MSIGHDVHTTACGDYAIGLGKCGQMGANTIVINATTTNITDTNTDRCFINPIRGVAHGLGVGVMKYNSSTHEVTYSTN